MAGPVVKLMAPGVLSVKIHPEGTILSPLPLTVRGGEGDPVFLARVCN